MGLIIKDKIQMLKKGYPTISDKYNVFGASVTGSTDVNFGDPLIWADSTANADGYNVSSAVGAMASTSRFAGFAVATNVKLATNWPNSGVAFKAGEAVGVLLDGYIAVELASGTTVANIKPGTKVCIYANTTGGKGVLNIAAASSSSGSENIETGYACTGVYENQGTTDNPVIIAEIYKI